MVNGAVFMNRNEFLSKDWRSYPSKRFKQGIAMAKIEEFQVPLAAILAAAAEDNVRLSQNVRVATGTVGFATRASACA